MYLDIFGVYAPPAVGLSTSNQSANIGSTSRNSTPASESVTASQVQGAPQPQGPSSTAVNISALSSIHNVTPVDTSGLTMSSGDEAVASPVSDWLPQEHEKNIDPLQGPGEHVVAHSTQIQSLDINSPLSPTIGTQTITANLKSQYIFRSGLPISKDSTPALGSGASIPVLPPQMSDIQAFVVSHSQLSDAITMPSLSKRPSLLTISGQIVTVDSLGPHSTGIQALTKSGVSTLSATTISLAPNESALVVGTSAATFGPSATAKFGSGSNGMEVQRFNGNALGARDSLWGSSTMLLVFFVVLLWL